MRAWSRLPSPVRVVAVAAAGFCVAFVIILIVDLNTASVNLKANRIAGQAPLAVFAGFVVGAGYVGYLEGLRKRTRRAEIAAAEVERSKDPFEGASEEAVVTPEWDRWENVR